MVAKVTLLPAKAQTVETATGSTSTVVPVKLHGLEASLSVDTMDLLADGKVGIKANINNGAAEIILPNGFQHTPEPGRFGYPLGFDSGFFGALVVGLAGDNGRFGRGVAFLDDLDPPALAVAFSVLIDRMDKDLLCSCFNGGDGNGEVFFIDHFHLIYSQQQLFLGSIVSRGRLFMRIGILP